MCYCGRGNTFEFCCLPIISGLSEAKTAEDLMRSRYSAYATIAVDYLIQSTHSSQRKNYSPQEIETWARSCTWQKLEIISTKNGSIGDTKGIVEFRASFSDENGKKQVHHERSDFVKENGKWYFLKGVINP